MSLPKIRLERCERVGDGLWRLDQGQYAHLTKSLRSYEGAMVEGLLPDDGGAKIKMRLTKTGGDGFLREISPETAARQGMSLSLVIGLLKSEQFDAVLRAASELGVKAVHPVLCERSVPKIALADLPRKMARWQKILDEGSKISGFACPAVMAPPAALDGLGWHTIPEARYAAILSPEAAAISSVGPQTEAAFAVGPEGDWTQGEAESLIQRHFVPVSLGAGILRSSTAAIVGCGWFCLSCAA
ncbi:MAG: RNA methyltransferase [Synergistaceae bacterium]|nr:RNA methyltransferase [Synergistaceae bacterium]